MRRFALDEGTVRPPPSGWRAGLGLVLGLVVVGGCSPASTGLASLPDGSTTTAGAAPSTPAVSSTTTGSSTSTAAATLEGADLVRVSTTPPPDAALAAVFQGYVEFWQADLVASARSDPAWAPLLARVTGQQLTDTVAYLSANRQKGQRVTGSITIAPRVQAVRGTVATLSDCLDLSGTQAVDGSGAAVPGTQGARGVGYSVTLQQQGSSWLVSNIDNVTNASCS